MQGGQAAVEFQKGAQLFKSQIRPGFEVLAQSGAVPGKDLGVAASEMMARFDAASAPTLLK